MLMIGGCALTLRRRRVQVVVAFGRRADERQHEAIGRGHLAVDEQLQALTLHGPDFLLLNAKIDVGGPHREPHDADAVG